MQPQGRAGQGQETRTACWPPGADWLLSLLAFSPAGRIIAAVGLWSCVAALLGSGVFPAPHFVLPQDGCSQATCLRHDSITARGSAHTKRPIQKQSHQRRPTLAGRRARGQPARSPCSSPLPPPPPIPVLHQPAWTAPKLLSVQFEPVPVPVPVPVPPCNSARCSTNPIHPVHLLKLAGLATCRLATSQFISLVCSLTPQARPCTTGDPILGLGTARHKPSQAGPVQQGTKHLD